MTLSRRSFLKYIGAASVFGSGNLLAESGPDKSAPVTHTNAASLPLEIQEIYPALFDGNVVTGGGFVTSDNPVFFGLAPSKATFAYDAVKNVWLPIADLPEARHHLGMASTAKRLYGIGGFYGDKNRAWQLRSSVYTLSDIGGQWQSGPDLPVPLAESTYGSVNDNIHVIGGVLHDKTTSKHADSDKHFVLADDNKWESAAPASIPRRAAASAVLNNRIYVIAGRAFTKRARNLRFAEVYDPQTDKWESIAPLPVAVAGHTAVAHNGKLIVTGGEAFGKGGNWKTGKAFNNVWIYDPIKDLWSDAAPMPEPRHGHGAVILNDQVFIIGGASKVGPQETLSTSIKLNGLG